MAITFQNQDIKFKLSGSRRVRQWIKEMIVAEKKVPGEINFVFMDDAALLEKNIAYLGHDTLTDIITFDSCEGNAINGDILISIERVRDNAGQFKVEFEKELQRVIIHGVLHLCGYKDKKRSDALLIRKKEDAALRKY